MLSALDISGLYQLLQDLVSSLLLMLPGISGELDWWIGLSDTGHEGHWLWVGESVFCYVLHVFCVCVSDMWLYLCMYFCLRQDSYIDEWKWSAEGEQGSTHVLKWLHLVVSLCLYCCFGGQPLRTRCTRRSLLKNNSGRLLWTPRKGTTLTVHF